MSAEALVASGQSDTQLKRQGHSFWIFAHRAQPPRGSINGNCLQTRACSPSRRYNNHLLPLPCINCFISIIILIIITYFLVYALLNFPRLSLSVQRYYGFPHSQISCSANSVGWTHVCIASIRRLPRRHVQDASMLTFVFRFNQE